MNSLPSLVGQVRGRLTVVAAQASFAKRRRWLCRCECGKERVFTTKELRKQKTCGCRVGSAVHRRRDITGQTFGRLTALHWDGKIGEMSAWACRCECGKMKRARMSLLVSGLTRSCGCLVLETTAKNNAPRVAAAKARREALAADAPFVAPGSPDHVRSGELCGVYIIRNLENGKVYIGSSKDIETRWRAHRTALRDGLHRNRHLQAAWNKAGVDAFAFDLLELCNEDVRVVREDAWVRHVQPFRARGYNHCLPGVRPIEHGEWTREKMRQAALGRRLLPETRRKIADARRGRPLSAEHRATLSAAHLKNRKETCPRGHSMSDCFIVTRPGRPTPHRRCRICSREQQKRWRSRRLSASSSRASALPDPKPNGSVDKATVP